MLNHHRLHWLSPAQNNVGAEAELEHIYFKFYDPINNRHITAYFKGYEVTSFSIIEWHYDHIIIY